MQKIKNYLKEWNNVVYENDFVRKFKTIFIKCDKYYDKNIEDECIIYLKICFKYVGNRGFLS